MVIKKKKLSLSIGLVSIALAFVWIGIVVLGLSRESEKIRMKEVSGQKVIYFLEKIDVPKVAPIPEEKYKISLILDDSDGKMDVASVIKDMPEEIVFGVSPYNSNIHKNIALLTENKRNFLVNIPLANKKEKKLDIYPELKTEEIKHRIENIQHMTEGNIGFYSLGNDEFLKKDSALEAAVKKIYDLESMLFYGIKEKTATLESEEGSSLKVRSFDIDIGPEMLGKGLESLEIIALKRGEAVGIVKIKEGNLEVIKGWLGKLREKGIKIVPAGALF